MLSTVVDVKNSHGVLMYAGCGKAGNGTVALQAVNTAGDPATLHVSDATGRAIPAAPRWEWVFTAGAGGDLGTLAPTLNAGAQPLKLLHDGSLPPGFSPAYIAQGPATLPPRSSAVLLLLGASAAACQA